MQKILQTVSVLTFGVAMVLASAGPSASQGLPGGASSLNETHGDWRVHCTAPEGAVRCAISQTQVQGENRQRVLAVELTAADDGAAANGALVLPFGLKLENGVSLAIDEAAPFQNLRFSTCLPAGCLVPLSFDGDAMAALRAGTTLAIKAAANDGGQEVALSVSLRGFTSALARAAELTGQ